MNSLKFVFFVQPPAGWVLVPAVGKENSQLWFARAEGRYIGTCGMDNNTNGCYFGVSSDQKCVTTGYERLYMNTSLANSKVLKWVRLPEDDLDRPQKAIQIEGMPSVTLVRAVLPNGDIYPGVWYEDEEPSFVFEGRNCFMYSDNPCHAYIEVLCLETEDNKLPTTPTPALVFSNVPPTPQHSIFPAAGFERNDPLYHGLVIDKRTVGKYGPSLGTSCNYCKGDREESAPEGTYHKLYCVGTPGNWSWIKMRPDDLKSLIPPSYAATADGLPPKSCLVRILVDGASSVHPGMWTAGTPPFYAWGGQRRNVTCDTNPSKLLVEVLCQTSNVPPTLLAHGSSLGFRPRDVTLAFSTQSHDAPVSTHEELMSFAIPMQKEEKVKAVRNGTLVPLARVKDLPSNRRAKLLVCHDFKGGYHESDYGSFYYSNPVADENDDDKPSPPRNEDSDKDTSLREYYTFQYWHVLDTFIYFAHTLLSLPTVEWINVCHSHHVRALGTFITEGREGQRECLKIFSNEATVIATCDKLAALAQWRGFEGYLINIENSLPPAMMPNVLLFVRELTKRVKAAVPFGMVLWYDAITIHGNVHYQNAVTEVNIAFADACDGIFTNYFWTPPYLKRTTQVLQSQKALGRIRDVYSGIDVFGRNTYKGGGYQTKEAVAPVLDESQSIAIFAPGWSRENCKGGYRDFMETDHKLWNYLSTSVRLSQHSLEEHVKETCPLFAGLGIRPSIHHMSFDTLHQLPFATSGNDACGTSFSIAGNQIASASKWCQQSATEIGFAFMSMPDPKDSTTHLAVLDVSDTIKVSQVRQTKAKLLSEKVFQGTRAIQVQRPQAADSGWVILLHGRVDLAGSSQRSAIPLVVVTHAPDSTLSNCCPLLFMMTYLSADGKVITCPLPESALQTSRVDTELGLGQWLVHSGQVSVPIDAVSLTGLTCRFAASTEHNLAKAPSSVIIGRVSIGLPQPCSHSVTAEPVSSSPLGASFSIKRFESGKAALLLQVTDKSQGDVVAFAVESHHRFEEKGQMFSQSAFCGIYHVPLKDSVSNNEAQKSKERVFDIAIPIDNLREGPSDFAHIEIKVVPELRAGLRGSGFLNDMISIFLANEL